MTRKHFIAIAAILDNARDIDATPEQIAHDLVRYFKRDNPLFDEDKFLDACGMGG